MFFERSTYQIRIGPAISGIERVTSHTRYDSSVPTFSIKDTGGQLRRFLYQQGYDLAQSFSEIPTFYIQVAVCEGPRDSIFELSSEYVTKAKKFSLDGGNIVSKDFFLLAVIFDLYVDAKLALFPDPWQIHCDGTLSLATQKEYEARIGAKARPIIEISGSGKDSLVIGNISTSTFHDLGLGQIRLVDVFPGAGEATLKGSIHYVSLDSPGTFWAVSYVWGRGPTANMTATLETHEGNLAFPVSLRSAMRAVREAKSSIFL
jgi:hypothetical protein